jgi:hypothetical protein
MKSILESAAAVMGMLLMLTSCTPEITNPELYGSVNGVVINSETNSGLIGVSIETTPATEAILTDNNGNFKLNKIPTGTYQIRASRPNFKSKSVSITVRENATTTAKLLIEPDSEDDSAATNLETQITSWKQTGQSDSSFVDVEYRVINTSSSKTINEYEIYFDIYTNNAMYYYEVTENEIGSGEQNIGSFEKFVRDSAVDSIVVSGVWVMDN